MRGWVRIFAGGENNPLDINIDSVEYAEYQTVNGRPDVVLHMPSGREFRIDPVRWELPRGELRALPEQTTRD